ncbi:MAG: ABC transporter permease subunit [Deltaproteobacteria bacterium]|jgi:NitT/TauT family transport system permease protein|nr:ABC transporter permease subunit [Deltaproteobacteria bacterium]
MNVPNKTIGKINPRPLPADLPPGEAADVSLSRKSPGGGNGRDAGPGGNDPRPEATLADPRAKESSDSEEAGKESIEASAAFPEASERGASGEGAPAPAGRPGKEDRPGERPTEPVAVERAGETPAAPEPGKEGRALPALTRLRNRLASDKAPLAALLAAVVECALNASGKHPRMDRPYFLLFLLVLGASRALVPVIFGGKKEFLEGFRAKDNFYAAVFLLLCLLNLLTSKFTVLPPIFFPAPDRILSVLVEDFHYLIVTCLGSSAKLLATGFFLGAFAGFSTGIAIGFSKKAGYWLNPLIKVLGPIPPTAWIPVVLVAFPTTWTAAVFLIALSVWFPTSVMTSSGILNVQNAYFEVSSTLGAKRLNQIFRVGIPAAMPLIFTGLFSGACASFLTLMTAEMVGVKNGIGWYIHWQRQMLSYSNVYAGLIVIAVTFYALITLFFKVRDRMLVWQKGMIKW